MILKFKLFFVKMPKKSKKQVKQELETKRLIKKIFFWIFFLLVALIATFGEIDSTLWFYSKLFFEWLFGEYYKLIFWPIVFLFGCFLLFQKEFTLSNFRFMWLFIYFYSISVIIWSIKQDYSSFFNSYNYLSKIIWANITVLSSTVLFFLSLYLIFRINYKKIVKHLVSKVKEKNAFEEEIIESKSKKEKVSNKQLKLEEQKEKEFLRLKKEKEELAKINKALQNQLKSQKTKPDKKNISKKIAITKLWAKDKKDDIKAKTNAAFKWKWKLPDINHLHDIWGDLNYNEADILIKQQEIVNKLKQFKINVTIDWNRVWPTVIQYRLKPDDWVKLNKIENLKKDLTLALHAKSIRIQAPIPGEWVVWIEVPNDDRKAVWLKEVINSPKFQNKKLEIPIAVWKDVNGDPIVWDLAKMPHLLIAGQTWSWKSVWMNWFLVSLLYKFSPSELKMILIDPKMVELSIYNGIPHLLTPVITNPDKALNSLKWAVAEMLRRYDLAKSVNARNLKEYNAKVSKDEKLPYIVLVVDELADLMMSWNKKEVESSIARIAQMARAVWMHLIIATQRPSVDVITWLIKANIPSRIAFTVASQIDSRTVIDKAWAEDLLWRWDMLYFPTWSMEPERVQWVLVETDEIESIINEIKLTVDPDMLENLYNDEIVNWKSKVAWSILEWYNWDQDEDPELVEKAIQVIREAKKWSTSLIQRKLWLWYARAAKILDILEELWVVWPPNWSKPREVYD